ncbi:hypothetical protein SAMN05444156_0129 [Verrucomicrobium sp. GAS474]|uniref:O-antigen ligase family protein n=1 Tax=Verrucomicrobium sp. GAS474 TaxID=1882831 RepID=UPI00087D2EB9|nr:hypothetical protein [Verrucomicrobium sp. GAS474]SDT86110.1 hypothetical protein SAMN05444156_0129 [Verrucomicrobium sp. GAS474]
MIGSGVSPASGGAILGDDFREKTKGVRFLIWVYIVLWIIEGALRKWVVPSGISTYLLFVREPVLIGIYALAVGRGVFPLNGFIVGLGALSLLGFLFSLMQSGVNLIVILYGARSYFLHFPLIFLIGGVMNRRDVEAIGHFFLYTVIPMSALMVMQFLAPPISSWNNGSGGQMGGQMIGALGHARPSGTFSFSNGVPPYLSLVTAFIIYGYIRGTLYPKWLLWSGLFSVFMGTVISVSRNAVVSVILVVLAFVLMGLFYPKYFRKFLGLGLLMICAGALMSLLPVFASGLDSLQSRFQDGGAITTSIGGRFMGDILMPWQNFLDVDMLGIGLGRATNAAQLYTGDSTMIIENEWLRTLWEMGWIIGSAFLVLRVSISCWLLWRAHLDLSRGSALAGLILSSCFINIFMTPLGLTTGQGFIMIAGGLCLAVENSSEGDEGGLPRPTGLPGRPRPRGRSLYAEQLHGNSQISGTGPASGA